MGWRARTLAAGGREHDSGRGAARGTAAHRQVGLPARAGCTGRRGPNRMAVWAVCRACCVYALYGAPHHHHPDSHLPCSGHLPACCRWNVCFAPPPLQLQLPPSTPTGKLASMVRHGLALKGGGGGSAAAAAAAARGGGAAGGSASEAASAKPAVIRQLNNYLGIGVDAKVGGGACCMHLVGCILHARAALLSALSSGRKSDAACWLFDCNEG